MFGPLRHVMETTSWRNFPLAEKNCCEGGAKHLSALLPNFARACGRVSVGRYPDKRPDSRQGVKKPRGSSEVRKSEAFKGGRQKQTRSVQHLSQRDALSKVTSLFATVTGSRRRTGAP